MQDRRESMLFSVIASASFKASSLSHEQMENTSPLMIHFKPRVLSEAYEKCRYNP